MARLKGDSVNIATKLILDKIEKYELLSGDIVSDLELSKKLNMSRTPIREAIMSLINYGILERTATRIVVKPITMNDIIEILEVREAVETKSAELIITKKLLTEENKNEFLDIQKSLMKNIMDADFDKNFDDDNRFHTLLVDCSGNERFIHINEQLYLQSLRLRWLSVLTPYRYVETSKEHDLIIESLLKGDIDKCVESIKIHLGNTRKNYNGILNNSQWNKIAHEIKYMKSEEPND